jgi:hypothetical protein
MGAFPSGYRSAAQRSHLGLSGPVWKGDHMTTDASGTLPPCLKRPADTPRLEGCPEGRLPDIPGAWAAGGDAVVLTAGAVDGLTADGPTADGLTVDGLPFADEIRRERGRAGSVAH